MARAGHQLDQREIMMAIAHWVESGQPTPSPHMVLILTAEQDVSDHVGRGTGVRAAHDATGDVLSAMVFRK